MSAHEIRALLPTLAEPGLQKFNSSLMPGVEGVLGVRMPKLRALAKDIAKGDWPAYLAGASEETYEETLLQGLVIGYVKTDFEILRPYITAHVEKLSNWSVCDTFCGSLKIAKAEPEAMWTFILPYFDRTDAYALRFGIVMALFFFLDDEHIDQVIALLDAVRHDDYYVKMAVAWALSMAYVAQPERVMPYLQNNTLDDWTHNKSLQKIIESRQVDEPTRNQMRAMKRKGGKQP